VGLGAQRAVSTHSIHNASMEWFLKVKFSQNRQLIVLIITNHNKNLTFQLVLIKSNYVGELTS